MTEREQRTILEIALFEALIILALCGFIYKGCESDRHGKVLPKDGTVSTTTFTVYVPVQGYSKPDLRKEKKIPQDVAKNSALEVTAYGTKKDDSGTTHISAVMNKDDGKTQLIEVRPIAEVMRRFEVGIGYGFESGDQAKAVQLRVTLGRLDRLYFTGQVELFEVDRPERRHPWNAMAFANFRF